MVVIVTGAAAGIGQATAGLLTAEGAVLVGVDRDDVESGLGREGSAIRADLTDAVSAPRIVETVMQRYGRVDGLVNNAGGLQLHSGFSASPRISGSTPSSSIFTLPGG